MKFIHQLNFKPIAIHWVATVRFMLAAKRFALLYGAWSW